MIELRILTFRSVLRSRKQECVVIEDSVTKEAKIRVTILSGGYF